MVQTGLATGNQEAEATRDDYVPVPERNSHSNISHKWLSLPRLQTCYLFQAFKPHVRHNLIQYCSSDIFSYLILAGEINVAVLLLFPFNR